MGITPGHSNRIFSVKFDPKDDNTLLSAGWDNTVQVEQWQLQPGFRVAVRV
jgi:WD40 repeat protein